MMASWPIGTKQPGDQVLAADLNSLAGGVRENRAALGRPDVAPGLAATTAAGGVAIRRIPARRSYSVFEAEIETGTSTGIIVGRHRDDGDYELLDTITVVEGEDQRFHAIALNAASETVVASAAGHVYYEVRRDLGGTWRAYLRWSATWPPASQSMDNLYWRVATNEWDAAASPARVSKVHQVGHGCPTLWQRQTLPDFSPVYARDLSTPSVIVTAGRVEHGGGRSAVSQATYDLATDRYIYVTWTYTVATRAYSVTGTQQTSASVPDYRAFSGGVVTYKALLGVISGGVYLARRTGIITAQEHFDPSIYTNWGTSGTLVFAAVSGTLQWLDVSACT